MGQRIKIFEMMLRPGVSSNDFEQFVRAELLQSPRIAGTGSFIFKGDRGDRAGGYLYLWLSESTLLEGFRNIHKRDPLHLDKLSTFVQIGPGTTYAPVGKGKEVWMPRAEEILIEDVQIKPGVGEAAFEQFVVEEYYSMSRLSGEEGYLFKGRQGDRDGSYMLWVTYQSHKIRQQRASVDGNLSKEMEGWLTSNSVLTTVEKFNSLAQTGLYTSYVFLD